MKNYALQSQRTVALPATIDLNRVRVFVQVVERGSFTAAARELRLPKSSVSRSIGALEKELGVRLLQRTTRALHLTDAGRSWFAEVRPALQSLAESTAGVRSLRTEPRGKVRVSLPADSVEGFTEIVAAFCLQYPEVELELSFSNRHVDLVAEGFDLAVRAGALKDSSLVARKIFDTQLGLFASPGYLKKYGQPKALGDLARHRFIGLGALDGKSSWKLTGADGAVHLMPVSAPAMLRSDSLSFSAQAAIAGLGVVLLPELVAGKWVHADGLRRILPEYRMEGGALYVVSPSRAFEPRAVTLFKEALIEGIPRMAFGGCLPKRRRATDLARGASDTNARARRDPGQGTSSHR